VNDTSHIPVLLNEVMQALNIQPDAVVVDATYGRGGHAGEIMQRLGDRGRLVALDRDPEAIADARRRFHRDARAHVESVPFSQMFSVCDRLGLTGRVNAVLLDLGVSSPQLDNPARGFSFRAGGPLDMRMDPTTGESAADWINRADEKEIADVIFQYGEERHSRRIARAITRERTVAPITDTARLAGIVAGAVPTRERHKDPATRTFQAIRLFINRELTELDTVLPQTLRLLAPRGRLAVISFHSLEDRRVKNFFRAQAQGPEIPPGMPRLPVPFRPRLHLIGKAVRASEEELTRNPRARSAVLRVAERTEEAFDA
jgi:16S rRNA (cytosine1402-N4)-methyltransferase